LILSGVVLAGANLPPKTDSLGLPTGDDGIMTAEEVVGLNLRGTRLVVLSACETGLGRVSGGEGVMGLVRAFHLAGARNVVASLWKVDDDATAALMTLFYHRLWVENKPPIEALREAQLTIYRHPEEIQPLAHGTRGPKDLTKALPLPQRDPTGPPAATAPAKLWAGFVLSGLGR
jgi:CHAT domain-containing protein